MRKGRREPVGHEGATTWHDLGSIEFKPAFFQMTGWCIVANRSNASLKVSARGSM